MNNSVDNVNLFLEKFANSIKVHSDLINEREEVRGLPVEGGVGLSAYCNAKCVMCNHNDKDYGFFLDNNALDKFKEMSRNLYSVTFSGGGEHSNHPQATELFSVLSDNKVTHCLRTNGSKLTPEFLDKVISPYCEFEISTDASCKEVYEKIRIGLDYAKLESHLEDLFSRAEKADMPPRISLLYVCQKANHADIIDYYNKFKNKPVSQFMFNLVMDWNKETRALYQPSDDELEIIKDSIRKVQEMAIADGNTIAIETNLQNLLTGEDESTGTCRHDSFGYCPSPWLSFFIDEDGWYRPCTYSPVNKFENVRVSSVMDLINCDEMKALRKEVLTKEKEVCVDASY